MDRIVGEVRHAISWLHAHLCDYGGDPGRIYVAGHSAGGHLTAMTMPLGAVRGGIAISGLYDLEPIRLNYLNEKLRLDEAETQRNSPMLNFPPMAGPLIVTYGAAELPELCRQSIDYAKAWVERGLPGHLQRSTGLTISRSSNRWPSQTASLCRLCSPWSEAEARTVVPAARANGPFPMDYRRFRRGSANGWNRRNLLIGARVGEGLLTAHRDVLLGPRSMLRADLCRSRAMLEGRYPAACAGVGSVAP